MDPFRRNLSPDQQAKAVMAAFAAAGARLQACPAAAATTAPSEAPPTAANPADPKLERAAAAPATMNDAWTRMKPLVTERGLQRNPDRVNQAMDLVFAIERQANGKCGAGTPSDAALLLIEKLHEGS
jgi:hypothetical protein